MKNITQQFNCGFQPFKALLLYKNEQLKDDNQITDTAKETDIYVESYDIGKHGKPINAHPLSLKEMSALSEILQTTKELKNNCLQCKGLLPNNVLYANQRTNGYAVWYTPPQETDLFFIEQLKIPAGKFHIPAMLWKANVNRLTVYALKGKVKPNADSHLYVAPYLNIYTNGEVCMGTVQIDVVKATCLEDFMAKWQSYFFNSRFSHSISGNNSTKTNTTELWRSLANTNSIFPQNELLKTNLTIKHLIR